MIQELERLTFDTSMGQPRGRPLQHDEPHRAGRGIHFGVTTSHIPTSSSVVMASMTDLSGGHTRAGRSHTLSELDSDYSLNSGRLISTFDRPQRHAPGATLPLITPSESVRRDVPAGNCTASRAGVRGTKAFCAPHVSNNPVKYVDPTGHREEDGAGNIYYKPLPPSVFQIVLTFRVERGIDLRSVRGLGTAIDSNAVLASDHPLPEGVAASQVESVQIRTLTGDNVHTSNDFLIVHGEELEGTNGGMSLFVFRDDFIADSGTESLGTVDALIGAEAEQVVFRGMQPGVYGTTIDNYGEPRSNRAGISYSSLEISPDLTVSGDSGAPLFVGDVVRAVNNRGDGIYGPIEDIGLIRSLIAEATGVLRSH